MLRILKLFLIASFSIYSFLIPSYAYKHHGLDMATASFILTYIVLFKLLTSLNLKNN